MRFTPTATLNDEGVWVLNMQDEPVVDNFTLDLYKKSGSGKPIKPVDLPLSGAQFSVSYFDDATFTKSSNINSLSTDLDGTTAMLTSDSNGTVNITRASLVNGGMSYLADAKVEGKQLPLGTYVIKETKAPTGYDLSDYYLVITLSQTSSGADDVKAKYYRVDADGNIEEAYNTKIIYELSEGVIQVDDPTNATYISTKKTVRDTDDLFDKTIVGYELALTPQNPEIKIKEKNASGCKNLF